jgi:AhpD family alkylhydroperoxidase
MGEVFYAKSSIKGLDRLKHINAELFGAFSDFDRKVFEEGALPVKAKELLAVACAHVTRCPYCIEAHVGRARTAGASEEEIAEAIFVATAMSAGASLAHACVAMAALPEGSAGSRAK